MLLAALLAPCGQAAWARSHTSRTDVDLPRLRPVLKGALYRSGSPSDAGFARLCREGFKRVYSLYGARTTDKGPKNQAMLQRGVDLRRCPPSEAAGPAPGPVNDVAKGRALEWLAANASRGRSVPRIFADVIDSIRDPKKGPVLVHCWNGLHYAGMVSAMALRQFCGASADVAEAYWRATANRDANYPHVIRHIREFRPLPGSSLSLTKDEQERVCPNLPNQRPRSYARTEKAE